MGEQIYKDFFDEAMNLLREEYSVAGKERDFQFYFNIGYIEDTFDTITVSVPSELMWRQMEKKGTAQKIQEKIRELTAQEITLIPVPKQSTEVRREPNGRTETEPNPKIDSETKAERNAGGSENPAEKNRQNSAEGGKEQIAQGLFDFHPNMNRAPEKREERSEQDVKRNERFNAMMAGLTEMIERQRRIEEEEKTHPKDNPPPPTSAQTNSESAERNYSREIERGLDTDAAYRKFLESAERQHNEQKAMKGMQNRPQLRDDYTFENFIPGAASQYAYSAAKGAAELPGKKYNPMLIYGGVGLGKTHLMQAMGHYIYERNPSAKICYISAESFTNEFMACMRSKDKNTEDFKKKYRNLDVLLLDDIQFLEKKEATQEELFHTFNAIYDRKGQLVFTCDRPIDAIAGITDRLKTRFSRGLNIDLQPPDYETRYAIIEQKARSMGKFIPSEVIDLIAENIQTNVRDLESSMQMAISYCELTGHDLTVESAREALKDRIGPDESKAGPVSVEGIQNAVARHYGLKPRDLREKNKKKQYVLPRQIAIYLTRKLMSEYSLKDIGREFGGRDHSTMVSSINKVEDMIKTNPDIASVVKILEKESRDSQ